VRVSGGPFEVKLSTQKLDNSQADGGEVAEDVVSSLVEI
jgi:hypothetical protein